MNNEKKNIAWINNARAVSIILVVLCHSISGTGVIYLNSGNNIYNYFQEFVLLFNMHTFFVISGYLYRINNVANKAIIKKKAVDLLIPYIIFNFIFLLIGLIFKDGTYSIEAFLKCIYQPIQHFWFIYVLFFVYVLAVFLDSLNIKKTYQLIMITIVYCFFGGYASNIAFPVEKIVYFFIFFVLGEVAFEIRNVLLNKIYVIIGIIVFVTFSYMTLFVPNTGVLIKLLCSACGVYILCLYCGKISFPSLSFIGKNTLPVYLLHSLFLTVIRRVLGIFHLNVNIIILISFIFGLICPLLITRFLQNKPLESIFYPSKIKGGINEC